MEVQRAARESDELNLDLDWDVEETINNLGKIERLFPKALQTQLRRLSFCSSLQ
eukprot:TRINITY_DN4989_c0_g1_i1.p4 TRINITY_DN4989_c0_g1~~TRINITY_DN4989_c0_g1_i1.p4  ORF type:complete len:54 (+),score=9.91 TRINITY_DN4989_c0_g1_i1:231-392(+)